MRIPLPLITILADKVLVFFVPFRGMCGSLLSLLLIMALSLNGCAIFKEDRHFDYVLDSQRNKIIISKFEPRSEFSCRAIGFLPCSLGQIAEQNKIVVKDQEHIECAKAIMPFAEKTEANFYFIESPLVFLGMSWRDSKANLFKCAWLPQPQ